MLSEPQLDLVETILSQFFSSINSNIKKVFFKRRYVDKQISYQLFFEKKIAGEYRDIAFSKESTGNRQLVQVLSFILCACIKGIIVIDEADAGVHDFLFCKVLREVSPLLEGQLIITTHNMLLMEEDFAREATYILGEEDTGEKFVKSISDYEKRTYLQNNIRSKYLSNEYKGLPMVNKIDFMHIIESLLEYIKRSMVS